MVLHPLCAFRFLPFIFLFAVDLYSRVYRIRTLNIVCLTSLWSTALIYFSSKSSTFKLVWTPTWMPVKTKARACPSGSSCALLASITCFLKKSNLKLCDSLPYSTILESSVFLLFFWEPLKFPWFLIFPRGNVKHLNESGNILILKHPIKLIQKI